MSASLEELGRQVTAERAAAADPTRAPHQQRVLDERLELSGKLGKLEAFRLTPAFAGLSLVEQGLLVEQAHHMTAYLVVLDARIKRFGAAA